MALVAQADAGSTARAARIAEARDILTSSPAEAFTTPSAFSAVTVDPFLQTRASLARPGCDRIRQVAVTPGRARRRR